MNTITSLLDTGNDLLDIGNGVFVPFFYGQSLVESRQNPLVVDLTFRHDFFLPVRHRHQFRPSREAARKLRTTLRLRLAWTPVCPPS